MKPLNTRIGLKEMLKGFTGGPEIQAVDCKHGTDPLRFELRTPGYVLANFNAGYQCTHLLSIGISWLPAPKTRIAFHLKCYRCSSVRIAPLP
jgi:hypothetical protein